MIYAYRRINPRSVALRFEHRWPADRTPETPPPWDDYNWDDVWGPDVMAVPGVGNELPFAQPDLT